jgi:hypothetical protein
MTTPAIERARQQVAADRIRIDETTTELRQLVHDRVDEAKTAVDPRTYIREYPWIALGLVFGAGIAIAVTGADRAAARGVIGAAKNAGNALGEKTVDAKDFVVEKVKGEEPDPLIYADGGAEHPIERHRSIGDRLLGAVDEVAYRTFKPVLDDMRRTVDAAPFAKSGQSTE